MVAYSCQKRFEAPIEQGFKTQTIRAHGRRRHARIGERVQLYVAMRTKQCRLILEATCIAVHDCRLVFERSCLTRATIDGQPIKDIDAFATSDGFTDAAEMGKFWEDQHGLTDGFFDGVLIEWAALPDAGMQ